MVQDVHHIQIRTSPEIRERIRVLAENNQRSTADIVRSSLDIGLRVLAKLLEAQTDMVNEYIALLKKDARIK